MTLPRLLLWLPRHTAIRKAVQTRPPHFYCFSQHIKGCTSNGSSAHHVANMLYTWSSGRVDYELAETFVNGTPVRARSRLVTWNDAHSYNTEGALFLEETASATGTDVDYYVQLNDESPQVYHGPSALMPILFTPAMRQLLDAHLV